ncbi:MAG: Os1348 family NHLP clan protein [Anaerolineae bacterium]
MSDQTLNNIMCMALIDGKFRSNLLSNPANVVGDFDLDAEEQDVLRTIKADSVTEFARKLHSWMVQRPGGNGNHQTRRPRQAVHRLFLEPVD